MKRKKSILSAVVLSTVLAGNVFAGDFTTGGGTFSFFDSIYNAVVSFVGGSPCEGRHCQTCKPKEKDGEGNCRPIN